jgi:hypothetical protein
MLSLNLPEIDEGLAPTIGDAASCKQWVAGLPLTNVSSSHAEILQLLQQLNQARIPALERLRINEMLREPVGFVQQALARKYAGKPIPFGALEQSAWSSTCALWQAMDASYRRVLQACVNGEAEVAEYGALVTQRCLRYVGLQMLERYRAYRQVEGSLLHHLHTLFAYAEQQDFATRSVKDSLNRHQDATTCMAAYVQALLIHAANPYQHSTKQLMLLDKWLDKWAVRVPVEREQPADGPLPLLVVDLESSDGARFGIGSRMETPRYLHTARLAEGLRKRIKFLRKGGAPAELDVGDECVQPACEQLLTAVYQEWCEKQPARACDRRMGVASAGVCFGMPAIHYFVSDRKIFDQPRATAGGAMSWKDAEDLAIFGRVAQKNAGSIGFPLDDWAIQDENAMGFCLARSEKVAVAVGRNRILALRPSDTSTFLVGSIRWLMSKVDGQLQVGVKSIPGVPKAIAARPVQLNGDAANKFMQALLLSEVPALKTPSRLILPAGFFQPRRLLELQVGEQRMTVKLLELLDKGADFELVTYSAT